MAFEEEHGFGGGRRDKAIGKIIHEGNLADRKKIMAKKMAKKMSKSDRKIPKKERFVYIDKSLQEMDDAFNESRKY